MIESAFQTTVRHHSAVYELKRAGGSISRICKRLFLVLDAFLIEPVECGPWHIYLASDLEFLRPGLRLFLCRNKACGHHQLLQDVRYMLHVSCHIVTHGSVTSCQCPGKLSVTIGETYRRSVELQLTTECERVSDALGRPVGKCLNLGDIVCIAKRKHRISVGELLEFLLRPVRGSPKVASDASCRGVLACIFGIRLLQRLQFLHEHVEIVVAERRSIVDIVPPVGLVDDASELLNPDICLRFFHNKTNYKFMEIFSHVQASVRACTTRYFSCDFMEFLINLRRF